MRFRLLVISAVALVCLFTSGVAVADTGCNNFTFTFSAIQAGINGTFIEAGATDCISLTITDRTISTDFSLLLNEFGILQDSLTMSNVNGQLDICFFSYNDGGAGTTSCSLSPNVISTQNYNYDPTLEFLRSPLIFDVPTGLTWYALMTSTDTPGGGSDTLFVGVVPEPSSLLLLGTGIVGAAGLFRRKLML